MLLRGEWCCNQVKWSSSSFVFFQLWCLGLISETQILPIQVNQVWTSAHSSITLNYFFRFDFPVVRFEPWIAGWEVRTLPLCYTDQLISTRVVISKLKKIVKYHTRKKIITNQTLCSNVVLWIPWMFLRKGAPTACRWQHWFRIACRVVVINILEAG